MSTSTQFQSMRPDAKSSSDGSGRDPTGHLSPNPAARNLLSALHQAGVRNFESIVAALLPVAAVVFNLNALYPEVSIRVPALNDSVLHLQLLGRTIVALATGQDPTDMWVGTAAGLGFPLFHYYQHLPYLPLAACYLVGTMLFRIPMQPADVMVWTVYLLLSLFPLSIYWSARRFGFELLTSGFAALATSLIATNLLYGFDFSSYVWRGYGLYTQLCGMLLLPPTLAQGYRTLREGRGYCLAALFVAATLLSHLVLGYIAVVSLVVLAVVPLFDRISPLVAGKVVSIRGGRLAIVFGMTALVMAYFFLPFLFDHAYMNRSVWELAQKYDSYGWQWVLRSLANGDIFDYGRFPSLTILTAAGFAVCLVRWREERYRVPVMIGLVWLLLYFGRPTWGVLLDLLPLGGDLQLHRLIAGIHLAGILLVGISLGSLFEWALRRGNPRYLLGAATLVALLLLPVYGERLAYVAQNATWMAQTQLAFNAEAKDLSSLVDTLRQSPPGRAYAGLAAKWGKDYRVGAVPLYAMLTSAGVDTVGYMYQALSLNSDVELLFDDARQEQYDLFNIRYVLTPVDWKVPDYYQPLGDFGRHRLYQVQTTGYFDLVGSDFAFTGDKADFYHAASRWLNSDLPRFKEHPAVLLDGATGNYPQIYPLSQAAQIISQTAVEKEAVRGRVTSELVESNAYEAVVQVDRESTLMLKSTYHPNWHAVVDGVETSTVMLMPSYVGVKLSPGGHTVQFQYRSTPYRAPLALLGMLCLLLAAVLEWRLGGAAWGLKRNRHPLATGTNDIQSLDRRAT